MLFYAMNYLRFKLGSKKGQGMVEYALLVAFAAAVAVSVFGTGNDGTLTTAINGVIQSVATKLNSSHVN